MRVAVVCASNMNRSMEAHRVFAAAALDVSSFGVGQHVKLPGASQRTPNVYEFGTPYRAIYEDLRAKDADLYTRNGLLPMLERNMALKPSPERWQQSGSYFDVVFTFEERVFDAVLLDLSNRGGRTFRPVVVVNLETTDSAAEARLAAPLALQIATALEAAGDEREAAVERVAAAFEAMHGSNRLLYSISFY